MAAADRLPPRAGTPRPDAEARAGLIGVGRVTGTHGLKGALRVRCDPDSTVLQSVARVYVEASSGVREYALAGVARLNRNHLKIALEGVNDVNAAEALRGGSVMVAVADLPQLRPGEFYYFQAIGCEVMLTDGRRLGVIEEVFATGANEVWVVRGDKTEVLVPVIENVVKAMDFERRRVTIEPIPGLLD
jgi:16S rRNA processing protein RimM